jgi:hypothetical protein
MRSNAAEARTEAACRSLGFDGLSALLAAFALPRLAPFFAAAIKRPATTHRLSRLSAIVAFEATPLARTLTHEKRAALTAVNRPLDRHRYSQGRSVAASRYEQASVSVLADPALLKRQAGVDTAGKQATLSVLNDHDGPLWYTCATTISVSISPLTTTIGVAQPMRARRGWRSRYDPTGDSKVIARTLLPGNEAKTRDRPGGPWGSRTPGPHAHRSPRGPKEGPGVF